MIGAALKFVSEKVNVNLQQLAGAEPGMVTPGLLGNGGVLIDSLSQAVAEPQDTQFIVSLSKA